LAVVNTEINEVLQKAVNLVATEQTTKFSKTLLNRIPVFNYKNLNIPYKNNDAYTRNWHLNKI
jgi:hypothetical protein